MGNRRGRRRGGPETLSERQTGVAVREVDHLPFESTLRSPDFDLSPPALRQPLLQQLAILEVCWDMNLHRNERSVNVPLFQQRLEEFTWIESLLLFPEQFLFID